MTVSNWSGMASDYDTVPDMEYDCRVPLHSEEAFELGLTYHAKIIGTLDIPRPTSRLEIVASMRRIRYEFKANGIKKKNAIIHISASGVKVMLKKRKSKKKVLMDENSALVMAYPLYRIFYVSHDSQDMKIFSYITREGHTGVFRCSVFKASKKRQAVRIVRTIGQAFEVCQKIEYDEGNQPDSAFSTDGSDGITSHAQDGVDSLLEPLSLDLLPPYQSVDPISQSQLKSLKLEPLALPPGDENISSMSADLFSSPLSDPLSADGTLPETGTPLSSHHTWQLLREQILQQQQQTKAALAQVSLLRGQLKTETSARLEAQSRTHELLGHNRRLLGHIERLLAQLRLAEQRRQQQQQQEASSCGGSSEDLKRQSSEASLETALGGVDTVHTDL